MNKPSNFGVIVYLTRRLLEHMAGKHNQKSHANKFGSADDIKGNVKRIGKDKQALKRMAKRARKNKDKLTKSNGKSTPPPQKQPKKGDGNSQDTDPKTWKNRLSEKEKEAVGTYTGKSYRDINDQLRSGKVSSEHKETVSAIDSALEKSRLKKDTTLTEHPTNLFRAADIPEVSAAIKSGNLEGLEFTDKGFVSTTTNKEIAKNFERGDARLFRINAPAGTKAGDVSSLGGGLAGEDEVLLARNTRFRVASTEKVKEKYKYRDLRGRPKTGTRTVEYVVLDVVSQD